MKTALLGLVLAAIVCAQAPLAPPLVNGGGGGGGGTAAGSVLTTVTFSATPTYAVSTSSVQVFSIVLTGNITSATLNTALATPGQVIAWEYCQDIAGGHSVAQPANVLGAGSVDTTAGACSKQSFLWDSVNANAIASSAMVSDVATPGIVTSAGTLALPTAPDTLLGRASTDILTNKTISGASNTLTVREADLSISDNTTANVSTSAHGFVPKLPNDATKTLNGVGTFTTPSQICSPLDSTQACLVDTFCGGTTTTAAANGGALGWELIAAGAGGTPVVGAPAVDTTGNKICGIKLAGQAAATDGAAITLGTGNNLARAISAAIFQVSTFRPFELRFAGSFNATTDIRWFGGLLGSTANPTTSSNGCFFHFDTIGLADSGIVGSCGNASSLASTSAVTADTAYHKYRMWSTVQGSVHFSIDGVEMTNSPVTKTVALGSTNTVSPVLAVVNGAASTTNSAEFYNFVLQITGLQ